MRSYVTRNRVFSYRNICTEEQVRDLISFRLRECLSVTCNWSVVFSGYSTVIAARHGITDIMMKMALHTITITPNPIIIFILLLLLLLLLLSLLLSFKRNTAILILLICHLALSGAYDNTILDGIFFMCCVVILSEFSIFVLELSPFGYLYKQIS